MLTKTRALFVAAACLALTSAAMADEREVVSRIPAAFVLEMYGPAWFYVMPPAWADETVEPVLFNRAPALAVYPIDAPHLRRIRVRRQWARPIHHCGCRR